MTPYWPSPLGATRRRLDPRRDERNSSLSSEAWRIPSLRRHQFPKPSRRITWVAETELDLPGFEDLDRTGDGPLPELG